MPLETQATVALQLVLATLFSMLIGIDRERGKHPAGVRTHMLVGLGSCLFTVLSIYAFPEDSTTRVAANIVVGIGFLGAGTIIKDDNGVKNLTTAASIWATAAVGMAVGAGAWFLALVAVLLIWFILVLMQRVEIRSAKHRRSKSAPESPEGI
ncbi:MAG: MgtC/SapB family protein [Anaerolineae bacterium]